MAADPEGEKALAVPKTAKQIEKEKKKKEEKEAKEAKFKAKQQKTKEDAKGANNEGAAKAAAKKEAVKEEKEKKKVTTVNYEHKTPKGQRKETDCPLPEAYSPGYVEAAWYDWWEKSGFFKPEHGRPGGLKDAPSKDNVFSMVIPPPNVTGKLHIGHALTNSVEDAITRWHRMCGKMTLWTPGCDHAGIATQMVVEKRLMREKGLTRHDLGREEFVKKVWEWKDQYSSTINTQLRRMGSSVDWDRAVFTMDPKMSRAVTEAFVRLHEEGTIYRSNRIVNWSCSLKSAISDIEVDKTELPGRTLLSVPGYHDKVEFGVIVSFAYKVTGGSDKDEIVVATTRIETMLGDTAVAVHPEDPRYKHLHGKSVVHPFVPGRKMPIVCDVMVERDFGTGAVKITPAHDPNDYEVGNRHKLEFITIFSDDGIVVDGCGQFSGMKRFDARLAVLSALDKLGLYRGTADNPMVVPICSRSKDIVEPLIKPQWYVKCDEMAKKATEAVKSGELKIIPEQFEKTWFSWMDGIRDWCISRQLWWGHRIPVYLAGVKGAAPPDATKNENWISGRTRDDALDKAAKSLGVDKSKITLTQDEDVLDTWFSSGLFPFAVCGWPDKTRELDIFYPGALLETGHDIIFFWVARMVFFGQKFTGKLPFKEIFLHAMVRDAHGRKMSKSLGNTIDPIDVISGITLADLHETLEGGNLETKEIEKAKAGQKQDYPDGIPECGTDALRFALCSYTAQGRDINLDVLRVQGYRFFCNKLWNATRFAMGMGLGEGFTPYKDLYSLLGQKSASGKVGFEHAPLPPAAQFKSGANFRFLDSCLRQNPFLAGGDATQVDAVAFERVACASPSYWKYKSFCQWYHRMNGMTAQERKALPGGAGVLAPLPSPPTNMDRWIVSRLCAAIKACNEGFQTYNFPQATTALHSYWLYDLCDVYLEYLKPLFQHGTDVRAILTARNVLYACLDAGLRLISPFMPFVSEELYQRLPRLRPEQDPPSIVVSKYPDMKQYPYRDEKVEAEVELMQKVVSTVRSTRSDYNLPNKTKTELHLRVFGGDDVLKRYTDVIATLSFSSSVSVSENPPTHGCAIVTVNDKCSAHIVLTGLIDPVKEVGRLEKKKTILSATVEKLEKAVKVDGYETKVPDDVKAANKEKMVQTRTEIDRLAEAIKALKVL